MLNIIEGHETGVFAAFWPLSLGWVGGGLVKSASSCQSGVHVHDLLRGQELLDTRAS